MAGKSYVVYDATVVIKNLSELTPKLHKYIEETFRYYAAQGEATMRKGAIWRDRTGNARAGLRGTSSRRGDTHELVLSHGMSYGIWLEVRWAGRYAIITPTLRQLQPKITARLDKALGRI